MSVILCLLQVSIIFFLLIGLTNSTLYWYETLNSPCPQLSQPQLTVRNWLVMFFRCAFGYFLLLVTQPLRLIKQGRGPVTPPDLHLPPVLLVHGLYHSSCSWIRMRSPVEQAGFAVETFSYRSFFGTVSDIVASLDNAVKELENSYPQHKPILVGHSLGGLLIRHWLQIPGNQDRITGIVTLATPHQGSKLGCLAPGQLAQSIIPTGSTITTLHSPATAPAIPCIAMCGPMDEAVLPACSLLPPEGWQMRTLPSCGHIDMLLRRSVAQALTQELQDITKAAKSEQTLESQ